MARTRLNNRKDFKENLDRLERKIAREFGVTVRQVRQTVTVRAIRQALGQASPVAQIDQLLLTRAGMADVLESMREAFVAGAKNLETVVPKNVPSPTAQGAKLLFRFDVQDAAAQAWLAQRSSALVVEVLEEQRAAIRLVVERGTRLGNNPLRTALDIVGRVNPVTGRREGGIVGLTSQQASWVSNARDELADPDKMGRYLRRQRRDKRFDSIVKRARREGRAVAQADVDKIVGRYSDRLLAFRGETIGRSEALQGFAQGRHQAVNQLIDQGVPGQFVKRVWDATMDRVTRPDHRAMNEQAVFGNEEPFQVPSTGHLLMHPGDSSLGAPAEQIINCRCYERLEVDFIAAEASRNGR